jgi:hypothetical protein
MDNIKVIRAETGPAGVKSKFDVYYKGRFVMSVRAFTPDLAKREFVIRLSHGQTVTQGNNR